MRAPRRLILLAGAPAAGKGTATSLVSEVTGIPSSIVMSDLLKANKTRAVDVNCSTALAPDMDACEEFRKAIATPPQDPFPGYMVDGFPRSATQADCLRRYLAQLHEQGVAPQALMLHLTVDKPTSIDRQQFRFSEAVRFNESVRRTARGTLRTVRETDRDAELAAQRYDLYRESMPALLALSDSLPVITIDASGNINEVRHAIGTALSKFERGWHTQHTPDDDSC